MTVREVLHAHLPLLHLKSTVRDAVDKMDVYQFPALVILDGSHGLLGTITEGDLCRRFPSLELLILNADQPAIQYASRPPLYVSPETLIEKAYDLMIQKNITLLPVVQDDVFFGIALRTDLMQAQLML